MPTYDYQCRKCGHRFELFHSIKDDKPKRCPRCRGRCDRVPSAGAGILFKGSGFYITDYRSREYREQAKSEKGGAGKSETTGGGAASPPSGGASSNSPSSPAPPSAGSEGGATGSGSRAGTPRGKRKRAGG